MRFPENISYFEAFLYLILPCAKAVCAIAIIVAVIFSPLSVDISDKQAYSELGNLAVRYPWLTKRLYIIIHDESARNKVDHHVILAIIDAESRGNTRAISKTGARGLMQIMPFNYQGDPENLFNPEINIRTGVRLWRHYLRLANGNIVIALRNYERGPAGIGWNGIYISKIIENVYGGLTYE